LCKKRSRSVSKPLLGLILGIIACFGIARVGLCDESGASAFVQGEILVKFRPGVKDSPVRNFHASLGVVKKRDLPMIGVQQLELPSDLSVESALALYRKNPDVEFAEPNYTRRAFAVAIDPRIGVQWGIRNTGQTLDGTFPPLMGTGHADIDANDAWDIVKESPNLIVAVIDSGLDYNHPDLTDEDRNDNGILDLPEDVNNNGVLDPPEDLNNNGILDPGEDTNNNGVLDPGEDVNNNGILDPGEDTNGNGILDPGNIWVNPGEDLNGNGVPDVDDYNSIDDDGDGFIDDLQGWNFVGTQACTLDGQGQCHCTPDDPVGNNDPMDDYGHGTPAAGIIAAAGNNHIGIAGVLWKAKILPVKFLGAVGCGSVGDEVESIEYAVQRGARIITVNAGGTSFSQSEYDAVQAANNAGVLFVAPAGNGQSNNDQAPVYPAGYKLPNVISVAASDYNDQLAYFSNFGKKTVDLAAPGDCIYSTMPTGNFSLQLSTNVQCTNQKFTADYDYNTGTSFAASFVAGVAGLLLTQDPGLTPEEIRTILITTSDPNKNLKARLVSSGRLNAYRALTRDTRGSLTGGRDRQAGCGTVDLEGGGSVPPGTAAATLVTLFLPLLLASKWFRRQLRVARGAVFFFVILTVVSLPSLLPTVADAQTTNPLNLTHQLSIKLGVHRYPSSQYFLTNSDFINPADLTGPAYELQYETILYPPASMGFSIGHYESSAEFSTICCSQIELKNTYMRITLKFNFRPVVLRPVEFYIGPGVGYDRVSSRITILGAKEGVNREDFDIHVVGGARLPVGPRLSALVEAQFVSATIYDVNDTGDSIDFGGLTIYAGLAWHFQDFRHVIFSKSAPAYPKKVAPTEPVKPEGESKPSEKPATEAPATPLPPGGTPPAENQPQTNPSAVQPEADKPAASSPPSGIPSPEPPSTGKSPE
jgi:subtilisin family serine protease